MRLPIILTDIEGTTGSIHFVKDVLFPYARERLPSFVAARADDPEVADALATTAREAGIPADDTDRIVATLVAWIDADRKATPLKALQGLIWDAGYAAGHLVAHVYGDAVAALQRWHGHGHPIHVYSSGSIHAQRLYFGHTEAGDLRPLIGGYYDTTTGMKRDVESYRRIAHDLGVAPGMVVFLSDIVEEIAAAESAGMRAVWVRRDAGPCPSGAAHGWVTGFDGLDFEHL
jgi:enolase-phosphatase E1